jgi:hypothetical protein
MDQVTQQNAALVEEAAAAAQSMQDQAGNLLQVVSIFKLDEQAPAVRAVALALATRAAPARAAPARAAPARVAPARVAPKARPASIAAPTGRQMPDTDWEEF